MTSLEIVPAYMGNSGTNAICIHVFVIEDVNLIFCVALIRVFLQGI